MVVYKTFENEVYSRPHNLTLKCCLSNILQQCLHNIQLFLCSIVCWINFQHLGKQLRSIFISLFLNFQYTCRYMKNGTYMKNIRTILQRKAMLYSLEITPPFLVIRFSKYGGFVIE